jgi:hypothetical protein
LVDGHRRILEQLAGMNAPPPPPPEPVTAADKAKDKKAKEKAAKDAKTAPPLMPTVGARSGAAVSNKPKPKKNTYAGTLSPRGGDASPAQARRRPSKRCCPTTLRLPCSTKAKSPSRGGGGRGICCCWWCWACFRGGEVKVVAAVGIVAVVVAMVGVALICCCDDARLRWCFAGIMLVLALVLGAGCGGGGGVWRRQQQRYWCAQPGCSLSFPWAIC